MANDIVIASVIFFVLFSATTISMMVESEFDGGVSTGYSTVVSVGSNQTVDTSDISMSTKSFLSFFLKAFIWDVNFHWILNIFFWILRGALVFILFRNIWPGGGG